jgi:hypothetical protein
MKRRIFGLGVVVALIFALALAGCKTDGGGDDDAKGTGTDSDSGSVAGTWTGTVTMGEESASATLTLTDSAWTLVCTAIELNENGTYSISGETATFSQGGQAYGTAVLSGSTLTVAVTSGDFAGATGTFTKK